MNLDQVVRRHFPDTEARYTAKDSILYALGVGFGAEPLDPQHLRYLYEEGLLAAPTFANVLGHAGFWAREPEYGIDWRKLLHAEQRLTMHAPLPAHGTVIGRHDVMGVRDKGERSGALLYQRKSVTDAASGQPICSVVTTLMLRGDGGCGDHGAAPPELEPLPEGAPELVLEVQTLEISPLIYRLSGDLNPLHIDPEIARIAGFERPILHGLCTKGFAGYALLKAYCDFEPGRLKSMALRFSKPVLPGDRIRFEFWQPQPGLVRFRATVPAREQVVLDRGTAEVA
ncbi:MaoC/PaaZ C-terminal domain-containing protein [Massilia cavernae]|uniref:3-alpha,7-alpha, 12-alpha-trihydroxy-5-beta-cholest-24-enoyl-CoA hydratase n=1 Tax=Massilia cavernae TaxID=2320864 RepID=A0A418Y6E5_9BURK|nr:MaoC/PaaZ C-terminal domain-containing protein [Massilia cavernae]RJG23474.1 3-alpha,7-alpha,12-alpha-trihydroxy-5-beta-cholest-24-enoyl-CoA hydratase [Massilia cavernae]